MSMEALIARIYADSETESQKILRKAYGDVAQIRNEYGQKLKKMEMSEREHHDMRVTELRNVQLAQAHREERRLLLEAREDLINKCFIGLEDRLKNLNGAEYRTALKNLLVEGLKVLNGQAEIRVARNGDLAAAEELIIELMKEDIVLEGSGPEKKIKPVLTLRKDLLPARKLGGVLLTSQDGKKVVDNTFSAVLERDRDELRVGFSEILFGPGG